MLTTAEWTQCEALIHANLKKYRGLRDYDDLAQECRIRVWQAVERKRGAAPLAKLAGWATQWAATDWFRSPTCTAPGKVTRRSGTVRYDCVSLDELESGATDSHFTGEADAFRGHELTDGADFTEGAIARLDAAAVWATVLAGASCKQRLIVEALFVEELDWGSVATKVGMSISGVKNAHDELLNRYRRRVGVPERGLAARRRAKRAGK